MDAGSHNVHHPELLQGEIFICNVFFPRDSVLGNEADLAQIAWKTKRLGTVAYRADRFEAIPKWRPVFAQEAELRAKGIIPRKP